jgi:hypothetical protein
MSAAGTARLEEPISLEQIRLAPMAIANPVILVLGLETLN